MRVLLLTPWDNAWVPIFRREVESLDWEFALAKNWNGVSKHDIVIHGWASGATQAVPGATNLEPHLWPPSSFFYAAAATDPSPPGFVPGGGDGRLPRAGAAG